MQLVISHGEAFLSHGEALACSRLYPSSGSDKILPPTDPVVSELSKRYIATGHVSVNLDPAGTTIKVVFDADTPLGERENFMTQLARATMVVKVAR